MQLPLRPHIWTGFSLLMLIAGLRAASQTWDPININGTPTIPAAGFIVDPTYRLECLSFYNAAYLSSSGAAARIGWTGAYSTSCQRGTTAAAYQEDIRRRINYYRAVAALPANITFDAEPIVNDTTPGSFQLPASTAKRTCAQASAYMNAFSTAFFDPYILSHTPVSGKSACWSQSARNGSLQSNLTIGYAGPDAIDIYMADENLTDDQSNNINAGHRRWILYSRAKDMASGDVPAGTYTDALGSYPILPSNALYIISTFVPAASAPSQFVTWPARGFVPAPLRPNRWSVSFPGASFPSGTASISMTGPGGTVIPVTILSYNLTGPGDNTLVFRPNSLPAPGPADAAYSVTVNGIGGSGVPTSYTWQTTFFDPTLTGVSQTITGPTQPSTAGADYQFTPVPLSTSYQVQASTAGPSATYVENGDSAAPEITADKTGTYPLLQEAASLNGLSFTPHSPGKSFHLCFPLDSTEIDFFPHAQSFFPNPEFIPAASSSLTFQEQFRWLFTVNRLSVEVTADGGSNWSEIYGRNGAFTYVPGSNYSSTGWDQGWIARSVSLAPWAGQTIRLRFILRPGDISFDTADINHGCYVDSISLTNVRRITSAPVRTLSTPAFRFDSTLTGAPINAGTPWFLRVRPEIGTRYMGYSTPLTVTPVPPTGYEAAYPALASQPQGDADHDGIPNLVEYAFILDPYAPTGNSSLPQPIRSGNTLSYNFTIPAGPTGLSYNGESSTNLTTWTPLPNTGTGNQRIFSLLLTPSQKSFMRLRIVQTVP